MLVLATLVGMMVSGAPAPALEVHPYGKVFVGNGVTVEMAVIEGKNADGLNDVLLKITGAAAHDAGIDAKTLRYSAAHGRSGIDFQFVKDGGTRNWQAACALMGPSLVVVGNVSVTVREG